MKVQRKVLQVLLLILSAGSAHANTSRCEAPMVEQTIDGRVYCCLQNPESGQCINRIPAPAACNEANLNKAIQRYVYSWNAEGVCPGSSCFTPIRLHRFTSMAFQFVCKRTAANGFTWTQGCVKHREFKQSCSSESARCPSGRCENIWGQRPRAVLVEEKTQGPLGCPGREPLDLPDSLEQILPSASLDEPSPLSQETELSEDLVSELLQPVDAGKCEEVVSNY